MAKEKNNNVIIDYFDGADKADESGAGRQRAEAGRGERRAATRFVG